MNATSVRAIGYALLLSLGCVGFCWGEPQVDTATTDSNRAAELVDRGVQLDRLGEHDKSLELYTEAIRQDESHVNAYYRRGLIYLTSHQLEKALEDAEKVIHLAPHLGHGYWLRGAVYGASEKLDKAYADYDEAIRLDPQLAVAYFGRGLVHQSRGNLHKALQDFDEAVRLAPDATDMQRLRAKLQFELGQGTARDIDGKLSESINVSNNSGRSIYPVVAEGLEGSIHLVWMDDTPGNFDIFYSKWTGEEWTRPENLSNNATLSIYPTVAVDLSGQVHVTWMDGDQEDEMQISYSTLAELNWSKPENVSRAKGISQRPQIAVDSAGVVHLVWYGNQGGFFELYHSRLVESKWTEPKNTKLVEWYITHNPGWTRKPALAAGDDGSVHVVWVGMEDVPSPCALAQNIRHSRWTGNTWTKPDNVSKNTDMASNLENPDIVVDENGNLHVVWEDRGSVWYRVFDGKQWSGPRQLNHSGLDSALPTVCCSETGQQYFAWLGEFKGKPQVFYSQLHGEQLTDSLNVSASSGTAFGCTLALDRSGQLHMVWMDNTSGEYEIIHRRLMPDE